MSNQPDPESMANGEHSSSRDWLEKPLARYRCYYTNSTLIDTGPVNPSLQVKARSAEEAARITRVVMGCNCVRSVERMDDGQPGLATEPGENGET